MNETLGQRIVRLRGEHNLSQGDLADALDISRQSVSKWENDISTPELDKLIRLAELFDLSMDALILGKEESTKIEQSVSEPESANTINLGYQKPPISQTQKIAGLMLIGISALFALICLVFFAWGGLLTALVLSSPLWGCGILCLKIRRHLGLSCSWLVFILVTGYLYYATGTTRGAMWNSQFWIYGDLFRKITSVIENILLIGLYVWTVITFRGIRSPKYFQLRMKPLIGAYLGIIVGYVLYFAVFKILLPSVFMPYMEAAIDFRAVIFTIYQIFIFFISILDLMWVTVLLLGARMLYNEHKAAKIKIE